MGDENTLLDEAEARHLLRRVGFEISTRDLHRYTGKSRGYAADALTRGKGTTFKPKVRYNVYQADLRREVHDSWLNYMLKTGKQFQEKMVLFWHDHFACSVIDVKDFTLMANQNKLLRRHCKGNVKNESFKTFVKSINRDAAMMDFLDTNKNTKTKPNENYGRELQELFTLGVYDINGVANYTQADIVQIAKAFSGWRFYKDTSAGHKYGDAYLDTTKHDNTTPKPVFTTVGGFGAAGRDITLGGTSIGAAEIDNVIDILFDHTDSDGQGTVARYITGKLISYLANANPTKATIDAIIARSNFDGSTDPLTAWQLAPLLREILVDDFFYAAVAQPHSVKWPVHYVVSTLRQLNMNLDYTNFTASVDINNDGINETISVKRYHVLNAISTTVGIQQQLTDMGQALFEPPTVFGWDWETAWTNSGTLLERNDFAVIIAQARGVGSKAFRPERLINRALTDPGDIVDAVTAALHVQDQFPNGSASRQALIDYLTEAGSIAPPINLNDPTTVDKKLRGLFCLVLESPAYQLQ